MVAYYQTASFIHDQIDQACNNKFEIPEGTTDHCRAEKFLDFEPSQLRPHTLKGVSETAAACYTIAAGMMFNTTDLDH